MARNLTRSVRRQEIHRRIRAKLRGTAQRPRLCVVRSLNHIYAQLVDDDLGKTITTVSTLKLEGRKVKNGGSVKAAKEVGEAVAKKALELGIKEVLFDRGGYIYHGRVKAVAEAAREKGLKF